MTGTAMTEANEFWKVYHLDVVAIPTNRPLTRQSYADVIYRTDREKYNAIIEEIREVHGTGRPILVGTTSIEKSELIAELLQRHGIKRQVLNAKYHESEAEIVAQAGRKAGVTIATNMAGRGTDIILGGNPEMLAKLEFKEQDRNPDVEPDEFAQTVAKYEQSCKKEGEEVKAIGGLHILGTERHESRRIDNQLRGRAGRQGDPGSTRFYLSLEDDLMRIFAGDKVKSLMERMGMPDDEPIEHPWVTKSISDAQTKVEGRNFDIRKNLLEYDDVMSEQRKTVYKIRQQLLLGTYTPEYVDETGKPTGKVREIKTLPRIVDEVRDAIRDMLLHYGTPMNVEQGKRPDSVEAILELFSIESLRSDVYQFWGYRFDFKDSEAKKPQLIYERLLAEIPQSLSEQRERLLDLLDGIVGAMVEESCPSNVQPEDWDWKGIKEGFVEHFGAKPKDFEHINDHEELAHVLYTQAAAALETKEKDMGTELLLRVFRHFYLEEIDHAWVEHLTNMEHLRDGIGLRGYGQRDPKQEYKKEGYDIFVDMMASTSSNLCTKLFKAQVKKDSDAERMEREDLEKHSREQRAMQLRHGSELEADDQAPGASSPPPRRAPPQQPRAVVQPARREGPKIGRNDPCPCGSGQKFKKCHGAVLEDEGGGDSDDATA
jgi:preprotein translocase subunit SecA